MHQSVNINYDYCNRESTRGMLFNSSITFFVAFNYSTNQNDYRWGRLHRIVFKHPLGAAFNIPTAAGAFPSPLGDLPGIPSDGGFQVIDSYSHAVRAKNANDFIFSTGPTNRVVSKH